MDLNLCISNGTVSTKIYDKRDDFDFDIVNFPFLDGDAPLPPPPPRRTSYGVYISQLIRFNRKILVPIYLVAEVFSDAIFFSYKALCLR